MIGLLWQQQLDAVSKGRQELRDQLNEQLDRFSQPVQSFSNVIAAGVTISAVDLTELYPAANTALAAAGSLVLSGRRQARWGGSAGADLDVRNVRAKTKASGHRCPRFDHK